MFLKNNIEYLLIGLVIIFFYSSYNSSFQEEVRKKQELENFKKLVTNHDIYDLHQSFERFEHSKMKDIRLLTMVLNHLSKNWDSKENERIIDSIIVSDDFKNFDPWIQSKFYSFSSDLKLKYFHPKEAYEQADKAKEILERNPKTYRSDLEAISKQKAKIAQIVFDNKQERIKTLNERIKRGSLHNEDDINANYNLAAMLIDLKKYDEVKKFSKNVLQKAKSPVSNELYLNALVLYGKALYHEKKYDSIRMIENEVLRFYENKTISKEQYYTFLYSHIPSELGRIDKQEIQQQLQSLYNYFEVNCDKSPHLRNIAQSESQFYKYYQEPVNEKKALERQLEYINLCQYEDNTALEEKYSIYNRLAELGLNMGANQDILPYMKEIKTLDSIKKERRSEYITFSRYLSENDINAAQNNFDYYDKKAQKQSKFNWLISIILIFCVSAAVYIRFLQDQYEKYQQRIEEKNKMISVRNKIIKKQNVKMKSLVDALQESNQNLQNFARVAAHDIKSPISTINNGISYLREKYLCYVEPKHEILFQNLNRSTQKLTKMIDELLKESSLK